MVNNQCVFFSLRLILSLIFLTILAYNTYSQEPGESISGELLKKANHCFEMRQYDSAVLLYKEFLSGSGLSLNRKDTDNGNQQDKNLEAQVSMQIANIYTLKEEYPSAESWYNIALNLADSWSRLKAEIYQNLGIRQYICRLIRRYDAFNFGNVLSMKFNS